jgi:hypothetical protein
MKVYKIDKNDAAAFKIDKDDRKRMDMYLDGPYQGVSHTHDYYNNGNIKSMTSYIGKVKFDKICVDADGYICQYTLYV